MNSRGQAKRLSMLVVSSLIAVTAVTGVMLQQAPAEAATTTAAATSVYVVAAGDIACDPSPLGDPNYYAAYKNGVGTPDGCRQKAVGDAVVAAKPDQFWALGDNQYFDGKYSKFMEVYDKAFGAVKAITHPIPGNHEWKDLTLPTNPGSGYYTYFGAASHPETNGTYSFDAGDWHVLAINDNLCDTTHPCGPGSALATWIASDIAANPKPCTVAMWHHPLWSLGEAHKGGYAPMVPVWNQLNDLQVDMVITGHDHNYVRTVALGKASLNAADPTKVAVPPVDPKGMVEFVIGTGGVDNYAASAATAAELGTALAAYQVGKPSPGLFGAGGFHLKSDRYTFSYIPAANSAPFVDNGGRTCRKATNGNPQDVAGEATTPTTVMSQKVTWTPTNTTTKAAGTSGGLVYPSEKAVTSGDGAITYSVTDPGTSGCTVDSAKLVIKYTDPGDCEITATAAATTKYGAGSVSVVFTITSGAPLPVQDITSVSPAFGPLAGGNTITMVGHGFATTTKVTIGGKSAKFETLDPTHISAIVPAGKAVGPAAIVLTIGGPQGAIVAQGGYTYEAAAPTTTTTTTPEPATVEKPVATPVVKVPLGNPAMGRRLVDGLWLLSKSAAAHASKTTIKDVPGESVGHAPVVRIKANKPTVLMVRGQTAGQVVNMRARFGGQTLAVGAQRSTASGWVTLPAFTVTKTGYMTVALDTPASQRHTYLKVWIVK